MECLRNLVTKFLKNFCSEKFPNITHCDLSLGSTALMSYRDEPWFHL